MAMQLNSMGGGAVKTPQKWMKYWNDKKSAVKKKAAARAASRNRTGGGAVQFDEVIELSHIEERILILMGGQSFATGDTHLKINPFGNHSSSLVYQPQESSENEVAQPVFMDQDQIIQNESPSVLHVGDTSNTQIPIIQRSDETYCPSDFYNSPVILPEVEVTQEAQDKTANMSPFVMAPSFDDPVAGPSRQRDPLRINIQTPPLPMPETHSPLLMEQPLPSTVSTPTRRRRRILQRNGRRRSPPSQRRSMFMSTVERFMENERRKEERFASRDQLIVDSMRSIENKMQTMVDIFKELVTKL